MQRSKLDKLRRGEYHLLCNRTYMTEVPFVTPFQKPSRVFDRLNFNYVVTDVDNREIKG